MSESNAKAVEDLIGILSAIDIKNADITSSNSGANGIDLKPLTQVVTLKDTLSQKIARQDGGVGPAALYNTIKGAAGGSVDGYVEEGKSGGQATFAGVQSGSYYKSVYTEISVTDEARYAAEPQIDLLAGATVRAMIECRRIQERRFLFGRSTIAADAYASGRLTTTADDSARPAATTTPVLVSDNQGTIANGTYSVIAVALAGDAFWATKGYPVSAAAIFAATAGSELLPTAARANGDGTTTALKGGAAIKSAAASTGAIAATTNRITATVAPMAGAVGYAWFVGTLGNECYQGTTSTGKAAFTSLQTGTQVCAALFTVDNSAEPLAYDGLLTRMTKANSGAQLATVGNGLSLTADGQSGITEFTNLFSNWAVTLDGYSPDWLMVSPLSQKKINATIFGTSTPTVQLIQSLSGEAEVTAGKRVAGLFNPIMGVSLPVIVNPYMPDGMALFGCDSIPTVVPSPNSRPLAFRARRDYWTNLWARTSRRQVPSVVVDGALTFEWLDGFGLVNNFAV